MISTRRIDFSNGGWGAVETTLHSRKAFACGAFFHRNRARWIGSDGFQLLRDALSLREVALDWVGLAGVGLLVGVGWKVGKDTWRPPSQGFFLVKKSETKKQKSNSTYPSSSRFCPPEGKGPYAPKCIQKRRCASKRSLLPHNYQTQNRGTPSA